MKNTFSNLFLRIKSSIFLRDVAILGSGALLAQVIPALSSPILTRLYSPADFGLFAVFMAIVSSVSPSVNGQYEVAVVLPKQRSVALELFTIAIWFGIGVTMISLFILLFLHRHILVLLNASALSGWVYIIPVVLFMFGLFNLFNYYANRNRNYGLMARSRLLRAVMIVIVNIFLGLIGVGFVGLVFGNIIGLAFAILYLLYYQRKDLKFIDFRLTKRKFMIALQYKNYPIYSGSTSLLDGVALALPIYFLSGSYSAQVVGLYSLTIRIMYTPLSFISLSISQVNLKKIVDLMNSGEALLPYVIKISILLIGIVLIPVLILILYAPQLFSFIFGHQWQEAGIYARILAPAIVVRFVASTMSTTLWATQHTKLLGVWKVIFFVVTLGVLSIFAGKVNVIELLKIIVISDISLYLLYCFFIYYSALKPQRKDG